jgi:hypothetical protein
MRRERGSKGCDRRKKEVTMIASTELPLPLMPLYRSHKIVRALQIKNAYNLPPPAANGSIGGAALTFEGRSEEEVVSFTPEQLRGKPSPRTGWYMIVYPDGYVSFSPAEAFEEGNTLMVDGQTTIEQLEKMIENMRRARA